MKCEDCDFWVKSKIVPWYGTCNNVIYDSSHITKDTLKCFFISYRTCPNLNTHKNHCCTLFVAAKITKE